MPDGEVYTGPVENSINGRIRFTYPGIYSGKEVEDIARARFLKTQVLSVYEEIPLSMVYSNGKLAGALIFAAVTQFALGLIVSEAQYSGYNLSSNYISDLGIGPSSIIFNSSVFLLGLLLIIGTYFLQRALSEYKVLTLMLILTSIGAMGVGVFTENFGIIHSIVSLIAFLFGGLSAIFFVICSRVHRFKLLKMPFSVIAVILGVICLGALVLFIGKIDLGLGVGGMERMILYPILMWGAGFGGYLIAYTEEGTTEQKPQ